MTKPTTAALPHVDPPQSWRGGVEWVWLLGFGLVASLVRYVPILTTQTDMGWAYAIEMASEKGWVLGQDIIIAMGPLAYFYYPFVLGKQAFQMVVLSLLVSTVYAWMLLWLTQKLAVGLRLLVLLCAVWLAADRFTSFDAQMPIMLFIGMAYFLTAARHWQDYLLRFACLAAMTILALTKFPVFGEFLIVAGILVAAHLANRQYRQAALLALAFPGALALGWVLAGQPLAGMLDYMRWLPTLSTGYSRNTSIAPPTSTLVYAAGMALLFGWALWMYGRRVRCWPVVVLAMGFSLAAWKHGFVQADAHHPDTYFMVVGGILFALVIWTPWQFKRTPFYVLTLVIALNALARWSLPVPTIDGIRSADTVLATDWKFRYNNFEEALQVLLAGPQADKSQAIPSPAFALPAISKVIGKDSIAVLGNSQAAALLQPDWNFQPLPVFQSNLSNSPTLQAKNFEFLRTRPPKYLLLSDEVTFGQYALANDSLAYHFVYANYRPVLQEKNLLLLRHQPSNASALALQLIKEIPFDSKDGVRLDFQESIRQQPIFISIELPHSKLGEIVGKVYQYANLELRFELQHDLFLPTQPGQVAAKEVSKETLGISAPPGLWQVPALIHPFMNTYNSIQWLWQDTANKSQPLSMRLSTDKPWAFAEQGVIRVFTANAPPAAKAEDAQGF